MLSFKKLSLNDIDAVRPYFSFSLSRACDNTVGGTFMWRDFFGTEYCVFNDTLIFKVKHFGGVTAFPLPLGADPAGSIVEIEKYCKNLGIPLVFCAATQEDLEVYGKLYSSMELVSNEDWDDYLYRAEDMINLPGRKYSGQRNHINYFMKNFVNFAFEEIGPDNLREVRDFFTGITAAADKGTAIFIEGREKTIELLYHYDKFDMIGGLLRVDGAVIGFAAGEILKDTLFVHVERADTAFRGAYQMLAKLFPKHFSGRGFEYVNREEDDGDPGLRTSKKACHPIKMIRKYMVTI